MRTNRNKKGFIATPGDLVRFGMAHLSPGYLKQDTLDLLFTSQKTSDNQETGVGIGWRIKTDWRGRRVYQHSGNISGARAFLCIYPVEKVVVAITTNMSDEPPLVDKTAYLIADAFLQQATQLKKAYAELAGAHELTGTFSEKKYAARLELREEKGRMRGKITGDFPLIGIAVKNELPSDIFVVNVWSQQQQPVLVLASTFGLIPMPLTRTAEGFSFNLDAGPAQVAGTLKKTTGGK